MILHSRLSAPSDPNCRASSQYKNAQAAISHRPLSYRRLTLNDSFYISTSCNLIIVCLTLHHCTVSSVINDISVA